MACGNGSVACEGAAWVMAAVAAAISAEAAPLRVPDQPAASKQPLVSAERHVRVKWEREGSMF